MDAVSTKHTHQSHYGGGDEGVVKTYHSVDNIFYERGSQLEDWQLKHTVSALFGHGHTTSGSPGQGLILADIGGGTGQFSGRIHDVVNGKGGTEKQPVYLVVDPSGDMLSGIADGSDSRLRAVCQGAEEFARDATWNQKYDAALLKEVVHHFRPSELPEIFGGLLKQLTPGGRLAVATRPHRPAYPFFEAAADVWRSQQPDEKVFVDALAAAGFPKEDITCTTVGFPLRVAKQKWLSAMRNRFWSTFSYFTDEQMEAGIREVDEANAGQDVLEFEERMTFITAAKPI